MLSHFITVCDRLEQNSDENAQIRLLKTLTELLRSRDGGLVVFLLTGKTVKRKLTTTLLKESYLEQSGLPEWMFVQCNELTGDIAETVALLAGTPIRVKVTSEPSLRDFFDDISQPWDEKETLARIWAKYPPEVLVYAHRWLLGRAFTKSVLYPLVKVFAEMTMTGKSQGRCLAFLQSVEEATLLSDWIQILNDFLDEEETDFFLPPFISLTEPEDNPETELQPQTICYQQVFREGLRVRMSRVGERVSIETPTQALPIGEEGFFPMLTLQSLPENTVIEGILQMRDAHDCPVALKQWQADALKKNGWKKLNEKYSPRYYLSDVLYYKGKALWTENYEQRHTVLREMKAIPYTIWEEALKTETHNGTNFTVSENEAILIPNLPYGAEVIHLKPEKRIHAILLYAGRTGTHPDVIHDEFTFALPSGGGYQLITIGKAISTLTPSEQQEIEQFIRFNTKQRFGPLRSLEPFHVFELGFRSVHPSKRHKSGIILTELTILAWQKDLTVNDAHTLEQLLGYL